jgi:transposase
MPQNFLGCDREQSFLMPPDPRDWLPEGHLAWFILATVRELDLAPFYASYRQDGWGRAAFEPEMMLSLLLYAYARGERSSRGIERRCVEDVAYRVIAAQQAPDHATIARFRVRHEEALADLFTEVLSLCKEAGLVKVGLIAIDGTKVHANASHHSNLDYEQLAREILKEAARIDAAEDELYGEKRGDELPEHLRTSEGRRAALADARRKLERDRAKGSTDAEMADGTQSPGVALKLDPEVIVARVQGRRGWEREAQHQLEEHRRVQADPIPRSRSARLLEAERRLAENLAVEREANEAYEHHRATAVTSDGRRFGARPNPYEPPDTPPGKINTTDLDSRNVKTPRSYTQGYNAQAVVNEHQVVLAAEVTLSSPDFGHLQPMVEATNQGAGGDRRHRDSRGRGRRQRLLARAADGQRPRWRHRGAGPARRRQARHTPARVDRRTLRLDAHRAGDRLRRRALPKTQGDGRARVRADQTQPPDRQLPATRQIGGALGVATDHRHPQPDEAPQAPNSRRRRLTGPSTAINPSRAQTTGRSGLRPHSTRTFLRHPPS